MDRTFAVVFLVLALLCIPMMLFLSVMIDMLWSFGLFLAFDLPLLWICVRSLKNGKGA